MIGTHVIFLTKKVENNEEVITERKGYIRDKVRVMDTYRPNNTQLAGASIDVYIIAESTGELHRVNPRDVKSIVL